MSTSKKKAPKKQVAKSATKPELAEEVSFADAVAEEAAETASNVVKIEPKKEDTKAKNVSPIKQALMDSLDHEGVLFNVVEEGVFSESGVQFDKRKMLLNGMTGTPMGIVSTSYNTVSNEQIFNAFGDALIESGINTDGMSMKVAFANGGAKTLVNFRFPEESVKISGDNSETILEIVVLNSFDGSTRYLTKAGGFRVTCMNGQLLGKIMGSYSSFHNQSLDVEAGAKQLVGMLTQFKSAEAFWTELMTRSVSDELAYSVIGEYFNREDINAESSGAAVRHMLTAWDRYRAEMGANAYSLYNTLTDFVSNKTYIPETRATGMLFNQNRLQTILDSAPIFKLAA